ncbi:ubiquitin-protein transferase [Aureococcus anophagefferens]|nr:ubiquitin-protein transferase [Aureococcus anophagefferens]
MVEQMIEGLIRTLREGDDAAKAAAALRLGSLACNDYSDRVLIAEAGGIAALVELLRGGSANAKFPAAQALRLLAHNNDANAVAIAAAVGLEALVELARRGRVTVNNRSIVENAALPAKRKAALVVAALLRDCVPGEKRSQVRDLIRAVIGPCL